MSGRPPEYRNRVIYTFSCEAELLERFKEIARREGKPVSRLLQELMEDYLKKHGRGNPAIPLERWVEDKEFVAMPTLGEKPNPELVQNMDNDMLERYVVQSYQHFELGKMEIRKRRAEGRWNKPYCW